MINEDLKASVLTSGNRLHFVFASLTLGTNDIINFCLRNRSIHSFQMPNNFFVMLMCILFSNFTMFHRSKS